MKSTNLASRYVDFSDEEDVEFDSEDSVLQRGEEAKDVVIEPTEKRIVPDSGSTDEPHDIPDEPNTERVTVQKVRELGTKEFILKCMCNRSLVILSACKKTYNINLVSCWRNKMAE